MTRNACVVGRVLMAEHSIESVPFGHVSTAKQATFQVAPRSFKRFVITQFDRVYGQLGSI